jgi:dTDP-glucose pyrophosphorylase
MVVSVVEKPHAPLKNAEATVGFYWWRRTSDLIRCICTMIANNDMVNNEYYLAPAYNTLLKWGTNDVRAVMVDEFAGLGTPEQVRSFEQAALVMEP